MFILKKTIFWLNTPYDIEYHATGVRLFLNWTKTLLKLLIWLILVFPMGWIITATGKAVGLIKLVDYFAYLLYFCFLLVAIFGIIVREYQIKDWKKNRNKQKNGSSLKTPK